MFFSVKVVGGDTVVLWRGIVKFFMVTDMNDLSWLNLEFLTDHRVKIWDFFYGMKIGC